MEINFHVHILKIYMRQKMPKYPHSSVQWTRQQKRSENFSNIFSKKKKIERVSKLYVTAVKLTNFANLEHATNSLKIVHCECAALKTFELPQTSSTRNFD
jgi:hypothetical protein